jgi:transporter family protein
VNWIYWALLSALFAGLTAILAKIGIENVDSNLATAIRTTIILVFTWAIFFFFSKGSSMLAVSKRSWCFLILSGFATGCSWICYFRALQLGEASRVAPIDKLSILFAIVLAAIFLKEKITWHHWIGGSFIIVGAIIIAFKSS